MSDRQVLVELYREANAQHRHEATLMFGQLAVFLAISGGLFSAYSKYETSPYMAILIVVIGILVTFCYYIIYQRLADFSHSYVRTAQEIEEALEAMPENNFNVVMHRRSLHERPAWFRAISASRAIIICVGIGWLVLLVFCMHFNDTIL